MEAQVTKSMNVYQCIVAVQGELAVAGISKDNKNSQQGYNFRGIDDIYNALAGLLSKAGLCILPRVIDRSVTERATQKGGVLFSTIVDMEFDFVSSYDSTKHTVRMLGEAMDSGDKSTNKAMSTAYKYACLQTFCIPTEGDSPDADKETHTDIAKKSVFSNASLRNTYCDNVIKSFEASETVDELNGLIELNKPKFTEMKNSGNEHDGLAVEELQKRYRNRLVLLKKDEQFKQQQEDIKERA